MKPIYIISDSTGETAERVIRAALSQFYDEPVRIHRLFQIRNESDINQAMSLVIQDPGMVAYTLVDTHLSQIVSTVSEEHGIFAVDLIGGLIYSLSRYLGVASMEKPGLLHRIDTDYYRRVEAVNFTVKHDDGQETRYMHKADLVLVGVSRSSKTPLSMYLAHKGYKVANVPLVLGIEPPEELFQIDQKRIVGLVIDPKRLVEIRTSRLINMRQSPRGNYADYHLVEEEVAFCKQLYRKHPEWMVINVTNKSVEESAFEIMRRIPDAEVN
ncbi:MAG: phosphoenolpyruvate synthase regulatory protein [Geobacteraceae bacterium GWC2_48_7]|nr:MAG: phosphoenolpyruvate synthase regulatory protein [Geobacteraceae bacterium GWC2_48_7]